MIILTLGSLVLIGGIMGAFGVQQYSASGGRRGKVLMFGGAALCLLSVGTYLSMIVLVASGM